MDVNETSNNTLEEQQNKKKFEPFKRYKYVNERKELTKKLLQALKVTNENKIFDSMILDDDKDFHKFIMDIADDIKKYFNVGKWSYFINNGYKKKKPYISLTKSIFKDMKIEFISQAIKKKIGDEYKPCIKYTIMSDISEYIL